MGKASIDEMLLPGILAVMTPISVGLLIGAKCLGGLLAGSIASGFMLAVMMSNAGGPFKDTSGPALNILIKLMTIFSLTMAPVFRSDWKTYWYGLIVLGVEIIMVGVAYWHVWVVNGEKCVPPEEEK